MAPAMGLQAGMLADVQVSVSARGPSRDATGRPSPAILKSAILAPAILAPAIISRGPKAAFGRVPGLMLGLVFGLALGLMLGLAGCSHGNEPDAASAGDDGIHAVPAHYKADIVAAMHAYLNDPTGIRDAAVSEPVLKKVGQITRYVACVKFNPKKNATEYAGVKEVAAIFLAGRFDQFIDAPRDLCSGVAYAPFPELQKLPP